MLTVLLDDLFSIRSFLEAHGLHAYANQQSVACRLLADYRDSLPQSQRTEEK